MSYLLTILNPSDESTREHNPAPIGVKMRVVGVSKPARATGSRHTSF